jgi:transposase InsO family protein
MPSIACLIGRAKGRFPHGTDQREFYQLLTYKDAVDLYAKLAEWEAFYNYERPHSSLGGKTPYERLVEKKR